MEDFIKFIPVALYVIYKLVSGGKKKEQSPNKRAKPRKSAAPSTTSLEDILRELTGQEATPATTAKEQYEEKRNKIEIEDHQYDFRPEYEHHADTDLDLAEVREEIRRSQGLERVELEEDVEDVDFDLREAIIAQTLLERPHH